MWRSRAYNPWLVGSITLGEQYVMVRGLHSESGHLRDVQRGKEEGCGPTLVLMT